MFDRTVDLARRTGCAADGSDLPAPVSPLVLVLMFAAGVVIAGVGAVLWGLA